jgi:diguanylate cyclase (GGDEF)-like protein
MTQAAEESADDDTTRSGGGLCLSRDEALDAAPWLIVMSGRSMGRMSRLELGEFTLGRSAGCTVALDDEGVSRRHARLSLSDLGATIVDLGSRNGTFVDDERIGDRPVAVAPGTRIRLGAATILKLGGAEEIEQQALLRLYRSATRDSVTNLFNRRFFGESLEHEVAWHRRHGEPLSLILLDVDLFKQVNTDYGHPVGDQVLKGIAGRLEQGVRTEDLVARYGGEEFAVILRHTDLEIGLLLAERLRRRIAAAPFPVGPHRIAVTASLGVATASGADLRVDRLLTAADLHLRDAKAAGRDRVSASCE